MTEGHGRCPFAPAGREGDHWPMALAKTHERTRIFSCVEFICVSRIAGAHNKWFQIKIIMLDWNTLAGLFGAFEGEHMIKILFCFLIFLVLREVFDIRNGPVSFISFKRTVSGSGRPH